MKHINDKWIYLILILIWGALFYFLTPIILLCTGQNIKVSNIPLDVTGDNVNYAIDNWSYYENLMQTITVDGWAFVETQSDNPNKTVKLIFASDDISYEIDTNLHSRQGLIKVFVDKNVPKERTGYSTSFSPLGMKNGEYFLYYYVYENDNNFGIINTGREFRKHFNTFQEIEAGQLVDANQFSKVSETNLLNFDVNGARIESGKLFIHGWALMLGEDSSKNRTYVEIQNPNGSVTYYSTKTILRDDVSEYFGDDRYLHSGFEANITLDALGEGNNIIRIIVGHKNRSIESYEFYWDGIEGKY